MLDAQKLDASSQITEQYDYDDQYLINEHNEERPQGSNDLFKKRLLNGISYAMRKLILTHNPNNKTFSRLGISRKSLRDGSESPDLIDSQTLLEWHHVYGVMQSLIASQEDLQNTVGVVPPYSATRMKEWAQSIAEEILWDLEGLSTKITPSGDRVLIEDELPSSQGMNEKELQDLNAEITKRNQEAAERRVRASQLLAENGFSSDKLFKLYLEAILESNEPFLGNPHNTMLKLDDCEQIVIPFHYNEYHYTVAVVHVFERNEKKIADIKYYDSLGAALDPELEIQLIDYFEELGFVGDYDCISSPDQKEWYNCSIFACGKAVDIANENIGNDTRLLGNLSKDNYKNTLDFMRAIFVLRLKGSGQNVKIGKQLKKDVNAAQEKFKQSSDPSYKIVEFNKLMQDVISHFEITFAHMAKKDYAPESSLFPHDKALSDIDPLSLYNSCEQLYRKAMRLALKKARITNPTQEEQQGVDPLNRVIEGYNKIRTNLGRQAQQLHTQKPQPKEANAFKSMLADYQWNTLLMFVLLGTIASFLLVPFLFAAFLHLGPMLSANPVAMMLLGGGVFFIGVRIIPIVNGYLNGEKVVNQSDENEPEQKSPLQDKIEQKTDRHLEEEPKPSLLNQFALERNSQDVEEILSEDPKPSVRRRLVFD